MIFTRVRVSLALLSLRKNGGLLVVYIEVSVKRESTVLRKNATKQCKKLHTQTLDEVDESFKTEYSMLTCQLFICFVQG